MNDVEFIMETEALEKVQKPKQFMALEASTADITRHDTQQKEEERIDEEREETGSDPMVDHDELLGEKTPEQRYY
jgi:hypothetical protein